MDQKGAWPILGACKVKKQLDHFQSENLSQTKTRTARKSRKIRKRFSDLYSLHFSKTKFDTKKKFSK